MDNLVENWNKNHFKFLDDVGRFIFRVSPLAPPLEPLAVLRLFLGLDVAGLVVGGRARRKEGHIF